jgi:hypothetical protein
VKKRVLDLTDLVNAEAFNDELILVEHAGRGGSHQIRPLSSG